MIRVLVVAPALAVRVGLRALLTEDAEVEIAGEAATLTEAGDLQASILVEIDVLVIADSALLDKGSAARANLQRLLLSDDPAALLLLTGDEPGLARLLPGIEARAWGALPLDSSTDELLAAVKALHHGLLVGAPSLLEQMMTSALQGGESLAAPPVDTLTEREVQVLQLLAQGKANKQIAVELKISEHTVKFHVSSIYSKLGATSRTEAVRLGVRLGLIIL